MTRFDATDRRPVDKWTAAPRPTTSPQGQKPQQKRSTHMVHKPVNSECSRHKAVVVGAKDRKTNKVKAKVVENTDAKTLQGFVIATALAGATVYTDDAAAYKGMPFDHMSVRHSVGEYVDGMADRVVLEHAQACAQRRLPQDQRQAPPK